MNVNRSESGGNGVSIPKVDEDGQVSAEEEEVKEEIKLLTPREIYKGLDEYVIGQHKVKVALSVR